MKMFSGFLIEILRSAIESIKANKLRALLTTLGIVIGVMTVIGVMSVISGFRKYIATSFSQLGANVIYVSKHPWFANVSRKEWLEILKRKDIGIKEFQALKEYGTSFKYISPLDRINLEIGRGEKEASDVVVHGVYEDFSKILNQDVNLGRFLSKDDVKYKRHVCVLGQDVVESLFSEESPIGKKVKIQGRQFQVIGILEERGEMMGNSMDNVVMIPYTTMAEFTGRNKTINVVVYAEEKEKSREEIRWILRGVRDLKPGEEDDFSLNSSEALISQFNQMTSTFLMISIAIAAISLVVGGIGIMNIMLVSVSERTREIGVRKAIGAKSSEILGQFLMESVVICLFGGLLGIILGASITKLISIMSNGNVPFHIPVWSIVLGFGFCFTIGVFFGFYPARKASKLSPVEALRYE